MILSEILLNPTIEHDFVFPITDVTLVATEEQNQHKTSTTSNEMSNESIVSTGTSSVVDSIEQR